MLRVGDYGVGKGQPLGWAAQLSCDSPATVFKYGFCPMGGLWSEILHFLNAPW
jgi:hypothetical protein